MLDINIITCMIIRSNIHMINTPPQLSISESTNNIIDKDCDKGKC